MTWSAKRKAILFSTALIAASALFLVNAAASTEGFLRPWIEGDSEFHEERALSRHSVTLAVVVSAIQGNSTARVQGAEVLILKDNQTESARSTDADGRALFQLRRGDYVVHVRWGDLEARRDVRVREEQRQSVLFDEEGLAHWGSKIHREVEKKRADAALLIVRVERSGSGRSGGPEPVPEAEVLVLRPADERADGRALVENRTTGARGTATFNLHRGAYVVELRLGNVTASQRLQMCGETRVTFEVSGEGIESRIDGSCNKGPHQEREPPRKGPPASDKAGKTPTRGRGAPAASDD